MKFQPLSTEKGEFLIRCIILEKGNADVKDVVNDIFFAKVIQKRIDVMKLPIQFTDYALIATAAFCEVVGEAVVLLMDCLTKYEGQTVGVKELSALYPFGFYDRETFDQMVLDIKDKKIKWHEVYNIL